MTGTLFLLGFIALIPVACQAPPPGDPDSYEARVADGLVNEAHSAYERRDLASAAILTRQGLDAATTAGYPRGRARALRLLAMVERRPEPLAEAIAISEALGDTRALDLARVAMAEIALANGQDEFALEQANLAADAVARWDGRQQRSGAGARALHLAGKALQRLDRPAEAASRYRQARLQLSLLSDDELVRLRKDLAMGLGDVQAALGDHIGAFKRHSEASSLSRQLGDLRDEVAAVLALSRDSTALGRPEDAATQAERAVRLALDGGDLPLARGAADAARRALQDLDQGPDSSRWIRLDAWLLEVALDHG